MKVKLSQGVAVVKGLTEYEQKQQSLIFVKAIAQGMLEINQGESLSLEQVKNRLGINLK